MDTAVTAHLDWLAMAGATEATIYNRRRALARTTACIGQPLTTATEAQLMDWRRHLTVAPASVCNYVTHVRAFYGWAIAAGLLDGNPAARIPVPKAGRHVPRVMPDDDLEAAVAAAPPRIRLWLVLAGWCGLRAREIALLRVGCIMASAPSPHLLVAADATKGTSERTVPLCPFVLGEIGAAGLPAAGYAFRRYDGNPGPNRPWQVSHLANRHLHAMGITLTLHSLRGRFATGIYRASGHNLRATQEALGHKRPETTALYTLTEQAEIAAAAGSLPVPRWFRRGALSHLEQRGILMRRFAVLLPALLAAVSLAACGTAAPTTSGSNVAASAPAAPSCHAQYETWKHGPARGHASKLKAALGAIQAQSTSQDLPRLNAALRRAGRNARALAAMPPPVCADPKGYYGKMLALIGSAGDNTRAASGLGGVALALAPLKSFAKAAARLNAELDRTVGRKR